MTVKFVADGMSAEIGGFSLSSRHREFGEDHYIIARAYQDRKLRESMKYVLDWISENIPNTSIVVELEGEVDELDPLSAIFAKRTKRDPIVVTNEIYKLKAIFAAPEDAVAFKLRWV